MSDNLEVGPHTIYIYTYSCGQKKNEGMAHVLEILLEALTM